MQDASTQGNQEVMLSPSLELLDLASRYIGQATVLFFQVVKALNGTSTPGKVLSRDLNRSRI